jgi:hypothetical protein
MNFCLTAKAERGYDALPASIQARVDKQLALLLQNLHHPFIRAKKYDEKSDV